MQKQCHKQNDLIIFGDGGHAKVIAETASCIEGIHVIGLAKKTNSNRIKKSSKFSIIEEESAIDLLNGSDTLAFLGIGCGKLRYKLHKKLSQKVTILDYFTAIHPTAIIMEGAMISAGTFLAAGSIVGLNTILGKHTIVNTNTSIDHDCVIGDFCSLSPGVTIGGGTRIGNNVMVGIGSTIFPGVRINDGATIGAGSLVRNDVEKETTVWGVPAEIKKR